MERTLLITLTIFFRLECCEQRNHFIVSLHLKMESMATDGAKLSILVPAPPTNAISINITENCLLGYRIDFQ